MKTTWTFKPHIAKQIFEELIAENNIRVFRDQWLDRNNGVIKKKETIWIITMFSEKLSKGKFLLMLLMKVSLWSAAGFVNTCLRAGLVEF